MRQILKFRYNVRESELPREPTQGLKHEELVKIIETASLIARKFKQNVNHSETQSNVSQFLIGDSVAMKTKEMCHKSQHQRMTS